MASNTAKVFDCGDTDGDLFLCRFRLPPTVKSLGFSRNGVVMGKTRKRHKFMGWTAVAPLRQHFSWAFLHTRPPPRAEPVKCREWGEGLDHEAVMQMEKACLPPALESRIDHKFRRLKQPHIRIPIGLHVVPRHTPFHLLQPWLFNFPIFAKICFHEQAAVSCIPGSKRVGRD